MKCAIEGNNVKAFGKAVHALARIGEDLWLDPLEKGLALRSVNSAHSAYACFLFSPVFFQLYIPQISPETHSTPVKCKLAMKSVLPLFRCLATIERNVDRCEISISTGEDRVVCQFYCRHGITKTHNLSFQESEPLQAAFPSKLCPNVLKAQAKLLGDIVRHFPTSQEEITLAICPIRVTLKNYYEEESDRVRAMYTEMSLHPDEFDYFQVGIDSHITFCLKELRGLLLFAESHALPVCVHFGSSGKPVSFSLDEMSLTATVVLATLEEYTSAPPHRTPPSQTVPPHAGSGYGCGGASCAAQGGLFLGEERVASSQCSPVFSPTFHLRKLLELHTPASPQERAAPTHDIDADTMCATPKMAAHTTPTTPTHKLTTTAFEDMEVEPVCATPKMTAHTAPITTTHNQSTFFEDMEAEPVCATPKMAAHTIPATPPTAKVRLLLFSAMSMRNPDASLSALPSLALASDSEEDATDDRQHTHTTEE